MSEFSVPKEPPQQLPARLIPITGVDFALPWQQIVNPINNQLRALRYETFNESLPHSILSSDHDLPRPDMDKFDPVRVRYDILRENYTYKERGVAKLGIQMADWKGLTKALASDEIKYEDWEQFSLVPVIRLYAHFHLIKNIDGRGVSTIDFVGDGDMISYATDGVLRIDGNPVSFADLGVDEQSLSEYVVLRKRLAEARSRANSKAINFFRESRPDIWEGLRNVYSSLDEVFNPNQRFPFMYLRQAEQLTRELFDNKSDQRLPNELRYLSLSMAHQLSNFFYEQTRIYYGSALRSDTEFYESIQDLAKISSIMYDAALNYW